MNRWLLGMVMLCALSARGQTPTPTAAPPPAPATIWRCNLPGGMYEVATRAMISVSSHEYIVDGAARVTEVNVDTQGNMAVRFYYIEPLVKAPMGVGQSAIDRASELAKEVAGRVGQDEIWKRVVKSYPTTTHSHTIEYRVGSEAQLTQILTSAQKAFETGHGSTLNIAE